MFFLHSCGKNNVITNHFPGNGLYIPPIKNDDFPGGWWVYGIVLPTLISLIDSSYPLVI
jgi:hypothetical protein